MAAEAVAPGIWAPRAAFTNEANLTAGSKAELWVVENSRCAKRRVQVAAADGDQVRIEAGLAAHEQLILAPPVGLQPGTLVRGR